MTRGGLAAGALVVALAAAGGGARAETAASALFAASRTPAAGAPAPIGSHARGCAAGLVELAETGPTWQAMRLSRGRNWGHPETLAVIADLGAAAVRQGWAGIYVGDISQPRGGPMPTGHRSHQIGLDADIWMLPPERLDLDRAARETISSVSVRTDDQKAVTAAWTPAHHAVLRAAAADPRVDRVFVAAAVKIEMCRSAASADTPWLRKIRPVAGHDSHFHIRLRCPAGAAGCTDQTPTVEELSDGGNGCDETLMWWVTDFLNPPDPGVPPEAPARHPRDYTLAELPPQCADVLSSP